LLGYLLDLGIRHGSSNRFDLDELMRRLNRDFAKNGRFFTDADLENIIAGLAPHFAVREFFHGDINGTGDLDYAKYLGYAGLALRAERKEVPDLGFQSLRSFIGQVHVESVVPDSNAEKAGLRPGDVLLKMNGVELPVTPDRELIYFKRGQKVTFAVQRGSKLLDIGFLLGSKNETVYKVEEMPKVTRTQLALRRGWLKGETGKGTAAEN
jgi:predicted metalloprotease with PDZ domain